MNIKLDDNGEWDVVGGDLNLIEGPDEISQIASQRLRFFFGEWFLDTSRGIPYFEEILKKRVNASRIDGEFIEQLTNVPGVTLVEQYDAVFDPGARTLTVTAQLQTIDGSINFSEVLP